MGLGFLDPFFGAYDDARKGLAGGIETGDFELIPPAGARGRVKQELPKRPGQNNNRRVVSRFEGHGGGAETGHPEGDDD